MLPPDFAIKGVDVWNARGVSSSVDVFVASGVVDKIVPTGSSALPKAVFEGNKGALVPSGVDLQVHIRTPGQYHKETPATASRSALRGGYAALLAMPNTFPVVDCVPVLRRCLFEYAPCEEQFGVKILQSAAVSMGLKGLKAVDFKALANEGAAALTDDGLPVVNDELMLDAYRASIETGLIVLQHAEWPGHGGALCKGPTQTKLGIAEYPRDAESKCVERDLNLLKKLPKARYHVLHVTTKRSVELIEQAKNDGLQVTAEVSPHHLYFCNEDIPLDNTNFKMNPPLFLSEDREFLRNAVKRGVFDFVATDHAPHEDYGKSKGFALAPFGTTGLESSFRTLLEMMKQGFIRSPEHLVELFSLAPARQMGLDSSGWGQIAPGQPLRAALWDVGAPEAPIELAELESLSKNNIFLGTKLPGRIKAHFTPAGLFNFA